MEPGEQPIEQALREGTEALLQHLKERARGHDVPIEATLWQHTTAADLVELTVVSRRKSYIFSLPTAALADPSRAAFCQEVMGLVLTAIKENLPIGRVRRNPHATERDRAKPTPPDKVIKKGTSSYTAFTERVEKAVTEAHETVERADQAIVRTRKTLQEAEEVFQRMAARRERDAERPHPTYHLSGLRCQEGRRMHRAGAGWPSAKQAVKRSRQISEADLISVAGHSLWTAPNTY